MDGELDNTVPGKVTGWLRFFRRGNTPLKITLDLDGDCHRDLQSRRFRFSNPQPAERWPERPGSYVDGIVPHQRGNTGDMTAGDQSADYVEYPYLEWYAQNGRVVLELERSQLEILTPEPAAPPHKLDPRVHAQHMAKFLGDLAAATGAPLVGVVGNAPKRTRRRRAA